MRLLDGVRVLDLSRLLPGAACTWYLQGLGAEVVKLEDPQGGDYMRHFPPLCDDGIGAWFHALNAGKRSAALNLKDPAAVEAVRLLLPRFQVLVESFRPGVMARLGLDPLVLLEENPHLVICSISGFGQTGPYASLPGHDLGYCGLAGALSLGERRDGLPDLPGTQLADIGGGALTPAVAVLAALLAIERKGAVPVADRWIDASMTEGAMAFVAPALAAVATSGSRPAPGAEALTGALANYGLYRCADGKAVVLAALEPKFWAAFQDEVGPVRLAREDLAALFATRPRDAWVERLGRACVTPVLELDELGGHEVHRARRSLIGEGKTLRVRPPFAGSGEELLQPVPEIGQHTEIVLRDAGIDPTPFLEAP